MTKRKLNSADQDLLIAAHFGTGEAFAAALENCIHDWPNPLIRQSGEWKQFRERLSQLGSALMAAVSPETAGEILTALQLHDNLAARCLAASSLPFGWSRDRALLLDGFICDHARVRECMVQGLQSLPDEVRREIVQPWIQSDDPLLNSVGVEIYPVEPPGPALAVICGLRPVEDYDLGQAVVNTILRIAFCDRRAVEDELLRWASAPRRGDAFLLSRLFARQPLREDLDACFTALSHLQANSHLHADEADHIIAALRALAREHGENAVKALLRPWELSASAATRNLAKRAVRRVKSS